MVISQGRRAKQIILQSPFGQLLFGTLDSKETALGLGKDGCTSGGSTLPESAVLHQLGQD